MSKSPLPDPRTINANPGVCTPTVVADWFVDPPAKDKFTDRAGNSIALLNCGEEYLPAFYAALQGAKQSIWIAIWGFDPDLPMVLDSKEERHKISSVLEECAKRGVQVKLLTWYNPIPNLMLTQQGDPSYKWSWWTARQRGTLANTENLQYKTRDLESGLTAGRIELAQHREAEGISENCEHGFGNATLAESAYPTHHQKMILIDHALGKDAIGFVQGINFWPMYFDKKSHPWREGGNHRQDVGLVLKGPCLIDLFHNFKESWNNIGTKTWSIDDATPDIPPAGNLSAQILRTWPKQGEFKINDFLFKALANLNHSLYVEDQYFRMPEFANAIKARARTIRQKSDKGKRLHIFVLTNPNKTASGESPKRQQMLQHIGRDDTDINKGAVEQRLKEGKVFDANALQDMEKEGVMVHVCCLKNFTLFSPGKLVQAYSYTTVPQYYRETVQRIRYGDVYVHAKLSIFDDAYLTLGSANWNARSMKTDSELNIAVQCHNQIATEFREKLWREHTNGLWQPVGNAQGCFDVEKSFERWTALLSKNMRAYSLNQPLIMNLFPLFEDVGELIRSSKTACYG